MSGQSGRYQRSFGGMIGAMIILVALILAWVGFRALTSSPPTRAVETVDYRAAVGPAREAASFDLLAPPSLPQGWRATTVDFTPDPVPHWHLGVLTDRGRYVGLEQGSVSVADLVEKYVDASPQKGAPVQVAGATWSTYRDDGGDTALARRAGGTSTLVVGHDVARADLESYAASLR